MDNTIKYPFYIRLAFTVISLIGIFFIFYMGKIVLIPILLAFLIAVLLLPIVDFLNNKLKLPNGLSSSLAVLLFVILIIGIFTFLFYEISDIGKDFIKIRKNINFFIVDIQRFVK
jgi:predicted PurR-regulated permease PerM